MPRIHLTLEERQKAEQKRREKKENFQLSGILQERIKNRLGYDLIREKTGISKPIIGKVVNHPELATVAQLRAVCAAAEIPLSITAEFE